MVNAAFAAFTELQTNAAYMSQRKENIILKVHIKKKKAAGELAALWNHFILTYTKRGRVATPSVHTRALISIN